ncbi:MAG: HlyD family secretion protein [Halioglobus sp.]|nr:HlyD family secretion protein [Halioglobus sp.]
MAAALLICIIYAAIMWLVFFKFKWLKFSIPWAVVSSWVGLHLILVFLVGMRFMTPSSSTATIVQYTIQLVPRLPEPTLVTDVLVDQNQPVKKGDPLIRFDRRPYEYQVEQMRALVAKEKQNVKVLEADVLVAQQKVEKAQAQLDFDLYGQQLASGLAGQGAGSEEESQRANAQAKVGRAALQEARAELVAAQARYDSQIDGVNTSVAEAEAKLKQAQYYLENTTIVAPEDGRIMNLQVRPGMVAGIVRFGAIASFICDDDRYMLATYNQENLKFVKKGQEVEVALGLYPGQIFKAKVDDIWNGSGAGQYLPSGNMPAYSPPPPEAPEGQFAVKIVFDAPDQSGFPIGGQGIAAIYTEHTSFAYLRRIAIRIKAWGYWLYPLPI